jgi:hypothetical protein
MIQSRLPFTDEGRIEVLTERISQLPPIQAWRELLQDLPYITAKQRAVALESDKWIVEPSAHQAAFHIDNDLRVVAIQGGWWYRGITAVEPHGKGSKITYVVVNIAKGPGRWIAHLFQAVPHRKAARRAQP